MLFPSSPTVGQQHPVSDPKWVWDGLVWERLTVANKVFVVNDLSDATTLGKNIAKAATAAEVKTLLDIAVAKATMNPVGALDIACDTGNYFSKTIAAISTFTFTSPPAAGTAYGFTLMLTFTSGTITWPASVIWPRNGVVPDLSLNKRHQLIFLTYDGGVTWFGSYNENYAGA